jgi:hypothetical protein
MISLSSALVIALLFPATVLRFCERTFTEPLTGNAWLQTEATGVRQDSVRRAAGVRGAGGCFRPVRSRCGQR